MTSSVAASAVDTDPPADSLFVRCRFEGVSLRLTDVYRCLADYEGGSVTLRLEHDRLGPQYRFKVLASTSRWVSVNATGTCVYNRNPACK